MRPSCPQACHQDQSERQRAAEPLTPSANATALKAAFKARLRTWAQKLEVRVVWLTMRPMRHKWASCSSHGHLQFSSDLLNLDPDLWDDVIMHEWLHFSSPNHGRLWTALMRAHLGDWETAAQ